MDPIQPGIPLQAYAFVSDAAEADPASTQPEHPDKLPPRLMSDSALQLVETLGKDESWEVCQQAQSIILALKDNTMLLSSKAPGGAVYKADFMFGDGVPASVSISVRLNKASRYDITGYGLSVPLRGIDRYTPVSSSDPAGRQPAAVKPPAASVAAASLLNLSNELLRQIAGESGKDDEGVNLRLRGVSKHLKAIADKEMSTAQRFLVENGEALSNQGINIRFKRTLAKFYSADEQKFILTHSHKLQKMGFGPESMFTVARYPDHRKNFILNQGAEYHKLGYDEIKLILISNFPEVSQKFLLINNRELALLGFNPIQKLRLACAENEEQRDFVPNNFAYFEKLNLSPEHLLEVSFDLSARQDLFQTYGSLF